MNFLTHTNNKKKKPFSYVKIKYKNFFSFFYIVKNAREKLRKPGHGVVEFPIPGGLLCWKQPTGIGCFFPPLLPEALVKSLRFRQQARKGMAGHP
jgi:hypothetical protein